MLGQLKDRQAEFRKNAPPVRLGLYFQESKASEGYWENQMWQETQQWSRVQYQDPHSKVPERREVWLGALGERTDPLKWPSFCSKEIYCSNVKPYDNLSLGLEILRCILYCIILKSEKNLFKFLPCLKVIDKISIAIEKESCLIEGVGLEVLIWKKKKKMKEQSRKTFLSGFHFWNGIGSEI